MTVIARARVSAPRIGAGEEPVFRPIPIRPQGAARPGRNVQRLETVALDLKL